MKALAERFNTITELGVALGHKNGAFIGQMISGHRPISEKTVRKVHAIRGFRGWFDQPVMDLDGTSASTLSHLKQLDELRDVVSRLTASGKMDSSEVSAMIAMLKAREDR